MGNRKKNIQSIGIDIGGTNTKVVWMSGEKILRKKEYKTPKNLVGFQQFIQNLVGNVYPKPNIGVGIPGVINKKEIYCPNISYLKHVPVNNFMSAFDGKKIFVDNDTKVFAYAEYLLGAGRGSKSMMLFTIGTGIGRAYGKDGKILKIKKFEYPEHWEKEYQRRRKEKNLAEYLAGKLNTHISKYKPEIVVFGGGVMARKNFLKDLASLLRAGYPGVKFKKAKLGKFAGAMGAVIQFKNISYAQNRGLTGL